MGYDAFISYRHQADATVAAAIERGLERIARPWNRLRAMSVFRDQSDLAAESDLTGAITRTLNESRYLVLIASPESAASPWVDKEVAHWCDRGHGLKQLIVVVTGGEFAWSESAGALTQTTDAVSPAVRSRFTTEPLWVDLRWARAASELSLRESNFRSAVVLIAATIRGVAPADLESEDVQLHRRARRLARVAVATVLVLALVASVAAVAAVANAREAERRARDALGRQLGLAALDMPASEVAQAFLLSLVAADLDSGDDADRFQPSRALIGQYSRLELLLHAPPPTKSVRTVAISAGGAIAATTTLEGTDVLLTWPAAGTREDPTVIALPPGFSADVPISFLDGGELLVGGPGGAATIDANGVEVASYPDAVAVDVHDHTVAERSPGGTVTLTDLDGGVPPARTGIDDDGDDDNDVVDLHHGRLATASGHEIVAVDVESGAVARVGTASGPAVTAIAAGPNADVAVVTASPDGIVPWSWRGDALRAGDTVTLPNGVGPPEQLAVALDGARVLVVGASGSAIVDIEAGTASVDPGSRGRVLVDPTGHFAAVGGVRLEVWDLVSGLPVFAVPLPVNVMAWSGPCKSRCRLLTVSQSIDAWDPFTRRRVQLVEQTNAEAVAISADGETVVSGGWGETVAVWQLHPIVDNTGRRAIAADDLVTGRDSQCAVDGDLRAESPDGAFVVTHRPDADGETTVCAASDGELVVTARLQESAEAVAVDNDGNVAVGFGGGFVVLYERDGDKFKPGRGIDVRIPGEPVEVTSLAYHADTIVAGLRPQNEAALAAVFVWPTGEDGPPVRFDTDFAEVPAVAFLDDAGRLVVAGRDRDDGAVTLQIWDTSTRRRVGRALDGLFGDVIVLRSDETAVLAADAGGMAYRWELDLDPTEDICDIVGRPLAADEWDELADGALRPYAPREVCTESTASPSGSIVSTAG